MSDLIDREYAIKRFCEDGTYLERHGVAMMTLCEAKQRAVDLIESFPSAKPERKKGKWINVNEGKWNTFEVLKCSVCGEMDNRMSRADNYCTSCGARMDGENDE